MDRATNHDSRSPGRIERVHCMARQERETLMSAVLNSMKRIMAMPWAAAIGVFIGVLVAPGGSFDWAWAFYDDFRPVVSMTGKIVDTKPGEISIFISGEKHRACQYLAIRAYAEHDGLLTDVNIERIDRPQDGHTKPPGAYRIGTWRVWPTTGAKSVKVYVQHSCDGRLVSTKIAHVDLPAI